MSEKTPDLSELLCTRLCHDLAGVLGAVENGTEILEDMPEVPAEVSGLISDSARRATARLKFYRAAFGRRGDHLVDPAFLKTTVRAYVQTAGTRSRPVEFAWDAAEDMPLPTPEAGRILLLLIAVAVDALGCGGTLRVMNSAGPLSVGAESPRAVLREGTEDVLSGEADATDPRLAPAELAGRRARDLGKQVDVVRMEDAVKLTVNVSPEI